MTSASESQSSECTSSGWEWMRHSTTWFTLFEYTCGRGVQSASENAISCVMRRVENWTSLVPRPFPGKAERVSGVLSDISCHMGGALLHGMVYKSLIRPQSFLGKLRTSCEVSFLYLQFRSKYDHLRHAHIIRNWFELSDRGATRPHIHVTIKVVQNSRSSSRTRGTSSPSARPSHLSDLASNQQQ